MGKRISFLCMFLICFAILLTSVNAFAATSSSSRTYVVVLDPGHGGYDTGTGKTYNGKAYHESEIVWSITNYIKKELAKQPNIKVYVTRKKDENPSLAARVDYAKKYNADLLVSLHLNGSTSPYAYGAMVLVSKGNYRPYLAAEEKIFGTYVMDELVKLGLYMRNSSTGGLEYKLSQDGSRYPNGLLKDYYFIVNRSIMADIPGVIIEHAFLTNYSDWYNFLSTGAKVKKLAQADVNAILKYFDKLAKTEAKNSVDSSVTNTATDNGWVYRFGKYFYFRNGKMLTNQMFKVNGNYFYVNGDGIRQTGWITYKNKKYYFDKDGKAHKKWLTLKGETYYFHTTKCYMYTGMHRTAKGNYYIFSNDGKLQINKWYENSGKTYYAGSKGIALKGYRYIDGKYYYFDTADSYMYKSKLYKTAKGNYGYAQSNGVLYTKGFLTVDGRKYYFNKKGIAVKGWQKINNKWYYFKKTNAAMIRNCTTTISNKKYTFDKNGVCISGK